MILPKSLPDTSSVSGTQSAGSFGTSQDTEADTQFNGIMANLSSPADGAAVQSPNAGKGDPAPLATASQTFNAAAFGLLVSGGTTAKASSSASSGALAVVPAQASKLSILLPGASNGTQQASSAVTPTSLLPDATSSVSAFGASPTSAIAPASAFPNIATSVTPASNAPASAAGGAVSGLNDFLAGLPSSLTASSSAVSTVTAKGSGAAQSRHASDAKASATTTADTAQDTTTSTTTPQVAAFLSGVLGLPVAPLNPTAAPAPSAKSSGVAAPTAADVGAASPVTGTMTPAPTAATPTPSSTAAYPATSSHADAMPGSTGAPVAGAGPATPDSQSGSAQTNDSSGNSGSSSHNNDATSSLASVVKSVTVETQLTPAPTLSPMQQVIDTVQKLTAGETAASTSVAAPVTTALPTVSSRTMTLVLEPENLGTVTVKMQLRGGSLDLQLDVSDAQTLGLLTKDKDSLTAAMTSQDYTIGTLTLRASDTQNASQGSDNGSQNQGQAGSQGSSSSQGGNTQGGSGSQNGAGFSSGTGDDARRNAPSRNNARAAQLDASVPSSSAASGLYI